MTQNAESVRVKPCRSWLGRWFGHRWMMYGDRGPRLCTRCWLHEWGIEWGSTLEAQNDSSGADS